MIRNTFRLVLALSLSACSTDSKAKEEAPAASKKTKLEEEKTAQAPPVSRPTVASPRIPVGYAATYRGDARRTGQRDVSGPRRPSLDWVFRTRGRIYADPVVAPDGTVYVASHDGRLYAVSPDGREKWSFDAGDKIWSSPSVSADGTIYFGSDADTFYALDPTGRVRWTVTTTLPPEKGQRNPAGKWDVDTAPAIAPDGTVYFGCHYYLYALRPSGELRWQFQAGTGRAKIFSSPAIGPDGAIYFGTQGNRFFAIDANANPLWNIETGKDNDSTPAVAADGRIFFGSDDGFVRAVLPGDGAVQWQADMGAPVRAPLALSDTGTLIVSTYGQQPFVAALDAADGAEKWRYSVTAGEGDFYGIQSGATIDKEGYVYFGARDSHVYCLTPDGRLKWRYQTGDHVDAGPVLGSDGTLYVGSDDRRLYAFTATSE